MKRISKRRGGKDGNLANQAPLIRLVGNDDRKRGVASAIPPFMVHRRRTQSGSVGHPKETLGGSDGHLHFAEVLGATERRLNMLLEERERLCRDLHERVLQSLYDISLHIDTLLRLTSRNHMMTVRGHAMQAKHLATRLIRNFRSLICGLEVEAVTEFDLEREIQAVMNCYRNPCRPQLHLFVDPVAAQLLTSEERRYVVHMAREAINNSLRHANANHVIVSLRRMFGNLRFEVRDDGVGLAHNHTTRQGFGLSTMATRAKQLGGRLRIWSLPNRGTQISLSLPLDFLTATHES